MSGRSPGGKGASLPLAGSRCLLILQRCLAIQLHKVTTLSDPKNGDRTISREEPPRNTEFWMYDSGYLLFQGFLEANLKCFWNSSLLEAMKLLEFQGYVAPGVLLVTSSACALEVIRAAWARNVLKPPNNYIIAVVGDIDDCVVQPLPQGQFTPLNEALCWVILDLTSSGQAAVLEKIRNALEFAFPDMQKPPQEVVYDALAKLMVDRKIYQTSQGYFVVTPERRRRDSTLRRRSRSHSGHIRETNDTRPMLMSTEEALALVHGEMQTFRDGDVTHQAIQTNLADVISGGNPNDKVLYARATKRCSSFPTVRLERRYSLRLFGSSKRLSPAMSRSGSVRHISNKTFTSDSSSSTDYPSIDCNDSRSLSKKTSLLARLFRRNGQKNSSSVSSSHLATFAAQFPPKEWFNPSVLHLHSVATQTKTNCKDDIKVKSRLAHSEGRIASWTDDDALSRAATLPRQKHHYPKMHVTDSLLRNSDNSTPTFNQKASYSSTQTPSKEIVDQELQSRLPVRHSRNSNNSTPTFNHKASAPSPHRMQRSPSVHSTTSQRRSRSSDAKRGSLSHSSVLANTASSSSSPLKSSSLVQSSAERSVHSTPPSKTLSEISVGKSACTFTNAAPSIQIYQSRSSLKSNKSGQELIPDTKNSASIVPQTFLKSKPPLHQAESNTKLRSSSGIPVNSAGKKEHVSKTLLEKDLDAQTILPKCETISLVPNGNNKSSFTLQVSASSRNSTLCSSGYSSQCQSSNGRGSVLSNTSSAPPYPECSKGNFTITSDSPEHQNSSLTTTTTLNGASTKIFIQQQNSPVRSVITFENGLSCNKDVSPQKDIIILNGMDQPSDTHKSEQKSDANFQKREDQILPEKPKLERPTSLYCPRELKNLGFEKSFNSDFIDSCLEGKKLLSMEDINIGESNGKNEDITVSNMVTILNSKNASLNNSTTSFNNTDLVLEDGFSSNVNKKYFDSLSNTDLTQSNMNLPSTSTFPNDPTMNNTKVFHKQTISPVTRVKSIESLSYKNVFKNGPVSSADGSYVAGETNNKFSSNPASPTKACDSFQGSYGNIFIDSFCESGKFIPRAQELYPIAKSVSNGYNSQEGELHNEKGSSDLCPYASLSDLTVHFKSITAQNIIKGVSINSIDTLVGVNIAATEKQNNRDVTLHTDFGMV